MGGWFTFFVLSLVLAFAAFYEFIEWGSPCVVASDVGQAFLGSQGDLWDAQWDMLLGLIGGVVGFYSLAPLHERSMSKRRGAAVTVAPTSEARSVALTAGRVARRASES